MLTTPKTNKKRMSIHIGVGILLVYYFVLCCFSMQNYAYSSKLPSIFPKTTSQRVALIVIHRIPDTPFLSQAVHELHHIKGFL